MSELIDEQSKSEFDRIEALASLDWSVIQSEKQRYLVKAILYDCRAICMDYCDCTFKHRMRTINQNNN